MTNPKPTRRERRDIIRDQVADEEDEAATAEATENGDFDIALRPGIQAR